MPLCLTQRRADVSNHGQTDRHGQTRTTGPSAWGGERRSLARMGEWG